MVNANIIIVPETVVSGTDIKHLTYPVSQRPRWELEESFICNKMIVMRYICIVQYHRMNSYEN